MIDKVAAAKLLGGTLARGIMWASAALAAKYGIEAMDDQTVTGVAMFVGSCIVAGVSAFWSRRKDQKLADMPPP
tara:strand:- start:493 stop:714 length:222 start_codon:yes stop_codon:yes gene_type:complete